MSNNTFLPGQAAEFEWINYTVFVTLVLISCLGGIWYGAIGSRKKAVMDIKDYLLGGRTMATIPVSLSLIASYVSGVTVLGTPAEIYNYGSQYWLICIATLLCATAVCFIYLPIFCDLRLSSSYEYLELRFNRHVRAAASFLFLFDETFFLPLVVYVPSLAFNQLTGVNVNLIGGLMVLVCGLYTVLGGLKAVVWTDAIQTCVMFLGVIIVAVAGTYAAGGVNKVVEVATSTGRLSVNNWSFNPLERQTGWGVVIGGFTYWVCFNSVNQTMVQRYIALPTKRQAVIAVILFTVGVNIAISVAVWTGLTSWTSWILQGCPDTFVPLVNDKLLPAYVSYIEYVTSFTGLSGIFLAGIFGAGLSSLSAILNACSLVAMEDIVRGWMRKKYPPRVEGIMARCVAALFATIAFSLFMFVEKLGGVLAVATSFSAIAASVTCGVFTAGVLIRRVGPRGILVGAGFGFACASVCTLGAQAAAFQGYRYPPLPPPEFCSQNVTTSEIDPESVFPLFRMSYHWIAPIGFVVTILMGTLASLILDANEDVDPRLLSPIVTRWKHRDIPRTEPLIRSSDKMEMNPRHLQYR